MELRAHWHRSAAGLCAPHTPASGCACSRLRGGASWAGPRGGAGRGSGSEVAVQMKGRSKTFERSRVLRWRFKVTLCKMPALKFSHLKPFFSSINGLPLATNPRVRSAERPFSEVPSRKRPLRGAWPGRHPAGLPGSHTGQWDVGRRPLTCRWLCKCLEFFSM